MKSAIIAILAVILAIGISGCASNNDNSGVPSPPTGGAVAQTGKTLDLQSALARISDGFESPGYTKEQVINLLGAPMEKRQINPNLEYWFYESNTDTLVLAFDPNTVSAKRLY